MRKEKKKKQRKKKTEEKRELNKYTLLKSYQGERQDHIMISCCCPISFVSPFLRPFLFLPFLSAVSLSRYELNMSYS